MCDLKSLGRIKDIVKHQESSKGQVPEGKIFFHFNPESQLTH